MPQFSGQSYINYPSLTNTFAVTRVYLEVIPYLPTGLLLYNAQLSFEVDYISILLESGEVVFSFSLGTGSVLTLRSNSTLTLNQWHSIEVYRIGQTGQLIVDDSFPVSGTATGTFTSLQLGGNLFLGGLPDITASPNVDVGTGFAGCIRALSTGSVLEPVELIGEALFGAGITECSSLPCGKYSCENDGTCVDTGPDSFTCLCPAGFTGPVCEVSLCELSDPCENNGVCYPASVNGTVELRCDCSLPYGGETCTQRKFKSRSQKPLEIQVLWLQFSGVPFTEANITSSEGYLQLTTSSVALSG